MRKINLDATDFITGEKTYDDQDYNKSENAKESNYEIEFKEDDKKEKEIDYSDPDYGTEKGEKEKEEMKKFEKAKKDEFNYNIFYNSDYADLLIKKNKKSPERSEHNPNEIPVGNAKTKKLKEIRKDEDATDGDEMGANANVFEKETYINDSK